MNFKKTATILTRYALALAFLSAVADRFGLWGTPGAANVVWGNYDNFLEFTAVLNPWAPKPLIPVLGAAATVLEIIFAASLMIGWRAREAALGSSILLLIFTVSMALTVGIKAPMDYSVLTASAASLLLFANYQKNGRRE
jgi:hypothetical protein